MKKVYGICLKTLWQMSIISCSHFSMWIWGIQVIWSEEYFKIIHCISIRCWYLQRKQRILLQIIAHFFNSLICFNTLYYHFKRKASVVIILWRLLRSYKCYFCTRTIPQIKAKYWYNFKYSLNLLLYIFSRIIVSFDTYSTLDYSFSWIQPWSKIDIWLSNTFLTFFLRFLLR